MASSKKKIGLVPKMLIAILLGVLAGRYMPEWFIRIAITFSSIFGSFLAFIIPLMILAFVTKGISDLGDGAGKLLGVTVLIAYLSTLIGGSLSYVMAKNIFPKFITQEQINSIIATEGSDLEPFFEVPIKPFFDVTSALVFAFMMGICISWLRKNRNGDVLYNAFSEFNAIITQVLAKAIVPLLPFFIFGNFSEMSYNGSVFAVLNIFWRIFICIIVLHLLYVTLMFVISGSYTGKNPFAMIKNEVKGYMTAVGTQSSAATIPVNLECAENNGVSREIADFVVPLGATVHMPGSMITITGCTFTILYMHNMPHSFGMMLSLIATLGVAMVAAPGAPGGAVMSALPFMPMVGIAPESAMASLLISLYLTQDSFGTAANISGDVALANAVDKIYNKKIKGDKNWKPMPVNSNAK